MIIHSKNWLMLLILSMVWGASFNLLSYLLNYLSPLHIVSFRLLLAGTFIWVYLLFTKRLQFSLRQIAVYIPMALLNNVIPFLLISWAMLTVSSSLASMFIASASIFSVFLSALFLPDERLAFRKLLGVIIGIIGIFFLLDPQSLLLSLGQNRLPDIALLGASLCYALAAVYGKKFGKKTGTRPEIAAALQVTLAGIIVLPFALVFESSTEQWQQLNWILIVVFLALTLVATLFAQLLYFYLLEHIGAVNTQLCNLLIPLFATIFGVWFLNEQIFWYQQVGIVIIGCGLLIIDGRLLTLK